MNDVSKQESNHYLMYGAFMLRWDERNLIR